MVVAAFPLYGSIGLPPLSASNFTRASTTFTAPGPRYFEIVTFTGGFDDVIGALAPVLYLASSSAQSSSGIGVPTVAVREMALARVAAGPVNDGPVCANRSTGGRLNVRSGLSSDDF